MPIFDTINNLQFYVQNVTIPQIADIVETETKDELNKQVEDKLYKNAFIDDDFYQHSFGLRNSAMAEMMEIGNNRVGKGIFIDIYLDPKSNYYSYYGNQNVTDKIVDFLNDGHRGYYKSRSIEYKGRGFFESTYQNLVKGNKLKNRISQRLKQLGYQLSR